MATLRAPLLSLGASGQLGKAVVASKWKGVPYLRTFVTPANPDTLPQQTTRGLFANCNLMWKSAFTNADTRTAWNLLAAKSKPRMSGYNVFMQTSSLLAQTIPAASMADYAATPAGDIFMYFKSILDGTVGSEIGTYDSYIGLTKNSMQLFNSQACNGDAIGFPHSLAPGITLYFQVLRLGVVRSGIHQIITA